MRLQAKFHRTHKVPFDLIHLKVMVMEFSLDYGHFHPMHSQYTTGLNSCMVNALTIYS